MSAGPEADGTSVHCPVGVEHLWEQFPRQQCMHLELYPSLDHSELLETDKPTNIGARGVFGYP